MIVVDPGHRYKLRTLDGDNMSEWLTFVKRSGPSYPGNLDSYPGTTSQEVLRALIDRSEYVNRQIPCAETEAAIGLLKAALVLFELRADRVHQRKPANTVARYVETDGCKSCGHVQCHGCERRKP